MLHFLRIHLKISAVSILTWLNVIMPNSGNTPWHDECRSEQLLTDLKSRSLYADAGPSMSVPPYDLSTPMKQWRYLGEKNMYAEYFELDDVLVFPGKYTPNVKWQVSFIYQSLSSSNDAEQLALVVSHDQGRSWTAISSIHSPQNDVQYAAAEYDGYANSNDLHFGVRRSGVRSKKLLIDQLSMIPDNSTHIRKTESISRPQPPLASNHKQIINADADEESNDASDTSNYDLASFTELLKSYIEYHKELEAAHALPMDNAAMEGMVELKLHEPAEPTIEAIAEILWNQMNEEKQSSMTVDNSLLMDSNGISGGWIELEPIPNIENHNNINELAPFGEIKDITSNKSHGNLNYQNTYTCHEAINHYFDYQGIYNVHAINSIIYSNRAFVKAKEPIDKNNGPGKRILGYYKKGIDFIKREYPNVWNECSFDPKVYEISEKPLSGEGNSICFTAVSNYMAMKILEKDDSIAENQLSRDIALRLETKPNGPIDQLKNHVANSCVAKDDVNQSLNIKLYDIKTFDNLQAGQDYFETDKNFRDTITQKSIPEIAIVNKSCSEAFEFIDSQADFWYKYLSAADTILAIANVEGYKKYSYRVQFSQFTDSRIALSYVIRYASLVLSKDGYLKKNMETFKNNCLSTKNKVAFEPIVKDEDLNYMYKYGPNQDGTHGKGLLNQIENTMSLRKQEHFNYNPNSSPKID